jgi:hypothetical protein
MKTLKIFVYILLTIIIITSCSVVVFDNINDYKGSIILKIEQDSVGTIDAYDIYIKDTLGNYDVILVKPEYVKLFNIGDTI